jgi:hypothetical protein
MPHLTTYVGLVDHSEKVLAESLRTVGVGHAHVADVFHTCTVLAALSEAHRGRLAPVVERYGEDPGVQEPERLRGEALPHARSGEIGLLRDLQDLVLLATMVKSSWLVVVQGAQGLRDHELLEIASGAQTDTERQLAWLTTRIKAAAPQALIVAP